jgi:valyl-tRNA synthetase
MLPKAYDPQATEDNIYQKWMDIEAFKPREGIKGTFTISMPPPNATGQLHLGHAVMLALEDIFIRFARMQGKEALWVPGTDHAAIATESVVIKKIQKEEKMPNPRGSLGREELLKRIQHFVENSKDTIRSQMRKIGSSCDWGRESYTMEPALNRIVNEMFAKMHKDGLIYRGERVVNWDTALQTTISDDEIEHQDSKAVLYTFEYLSSEQTGGEPLFVATSRPETKIADTAIAVHPDDKRYKKLIGKDFEVEWPHGRKVKVTVIADHTIDPEFGTGALGVTPFHSKIDYELWQRHKEEIISSPFQLIGEDGLILKNIDGYAGLSVPEARKLMVEGLREQGRLKSEDEYVQPLSISYRSKKPVEPLPKLQWFIDVNKKVDTWQGKWKGKNMSLKEVMLDTVKSKDIEIIPNHFEKTYFHWIDNLQDWCISRQIWWGHQVPIWYSLEKDSKVALRFFAGKMAGPESDGKWISHEEYVQGDRNRANLLFNIVDLIENPENYPETLEGKGMPSGNIQEKIAYLQEEFGFNISNTDPEHMTSAFSYEEACNKLGTKYVVQDPDTLDTWFSSALWTWSTLIDKKKALNPNITFDQLLESDDFKKFHPTQVMETGYDILFFWVARMILMTTYGIGQIPFKKVYLHGLIRTRDGAKMSKSHPETMIDPLDVISQYGADALRMSMIVGQSPGNDQKLYEEKIAGYRNFINKLWNASRFVLMQCKEAQVDPQDFDDNYQANSLVDSALVYELLQVRSDVTLGIEKYRLSEAGEKLYSFIWDYYCDWYLELSKNEPNLNLLVSSLREILILLHPYCPFVTEEIWSSIKQKNAGMLIGHSWPLPISTTPELIKIDEQYHNVLEGVIKKIRQMRSEYDISSEKKVIIFALSSAPVSNNTSIYNHMNENQILRDYKNQIMRMCNLEDLIIGLSEPNTVNCAVSYSRYVEIQMPLVGLVDFSNAIQKTELDIVKVKKFISSLEKKLSNSGFIKNASEKIVNEEKEKLFSKKLLEENLQKKKKILSDNLE